MSSKPPDASASSSSHACEQTHALLRATPSDKYHPLALTKSKTDGKDQTKKKGKESGDEAAALPWPHKRQLLLRFGLTYLGYAALLVARKAFSSTKHLLQAELDLSARTLGVARAR